MQNHGFEQKSWELDDLLTPSGRHCIPARLAARLADRGAIRGH